MIVLQVWRDQAVNPSYISSGKTKVSVSQLLGPIKDATSDARSVSQLDCDNSSITTGNKATCVVIDFMMFGFAGAVIAIIFGGIGGGLISKRIKKE